MESEYIKYIKVTPKSYGNYSSNNYGVNALMFTDVNDIEYYFSYKTLVAFNHKSLWGNGGLVIRKNIWGTTTGKHLNWIDDDKSKRVKKKLLNFKNFKLTISFFKYTLIP